MKLKLFVRRTLSFVFMGIACITTLLFGGWYAKMDGDPNLWKVLVPTIIISGLLSWVFTD